MPLTEKNIVIAMLSKLMSDYGVRNVVSSPGSRNFPLLTAFVRNKLLNVSSVVDERSAAFSALGIADVTRRPVVISCTSGTALLNYAPAVAEAYYRGLPIIVISADRPKEWIGQNDGQTIVQTDAFSNYIAAGYDISNDDSSELAFIHANRVINEALTTAISLSRPVHLNVHIGEPLEECDAALVERDCRVISTDFPQKRLASDTIREMAGKIASSEKVMVFIGQLPPDRTLNNALMKIARLRNAVVVGQNTSNLHIPEAIHSIDALLSQTDATSLDMLAPDLLITAGGGATSRLFKELLRNADSIKEHWHISPSGETIDCFMKLSRTIVSDPGIFFHQLASQKRIVGDCRSTYAADWQSLREDARRSTSRFVGKAPWCDLTAVMAVLDKVPSKWNIQCSNGMSIRYCDLFDCGKFHRFSSNRGCNGIDGSTSTAIGASSVFDGTTLLISGDMSASYDLSAFMSPLISTRFKMIIIENGGGDIFRCIRATRDVAERESHISCPRPIDWSHMAATAAMRFFSAASMTELEQQLPEFLNESTRPCLLVLSTPQDVNSKVYSDYLRRNRPETNQTEIKPQ